MSVVQMDVSTNENLDELASGCYNKYPEPQKLTKKVYFGQQVAVSPTIGWPVAYACGKTGHRVERAQPLNAQWLGSELAGQRETAWLPLSSAMGTIGSQKAFHDASLLFKFFISWFSFF